MSLIHPSRSMQSPGNITDGYSLEVSARDITALTVASAMAA